MGQHIDKSVSAFDIPSYSPEHYHRGDRTAALRTPPTKRGQAK